MKSKAKPKDAEVHADAKAKARKREEPSIGCYYHLRKTDSASLRPFFRKFANFYNHQRYDNRSQHLLPFCFGGLLYNFFRTRERLAILPEDFLRSEIRRWTLDNELAKLFPNAVVPTS